MTKDNRNTPSPVAQRFYWRVETTDELSSGILTKENVKNILRNNSPRSWQRFMFELWDRDLIFVSNGEDIAIYSLRTTPNKTAESANFAVMFLGRGYDTLNTHMANFNNPHKTTLQQVFDNQSDIDAIMQGNIYKGTVKPKNKVATIEDMPDLDAHEKDFENPHKTTLQQVFNKQDKTDAIMRGDIYKGEIEPENKLATIKDTKLTNDSVDDTAIGVREVEDVVDEENLTLTPTAKKFTQWLQMIYSNLKLLFSKIPKGVEQTANLSNEIAGNSITSNKIGTAGILPVSKGGTDKEKHTPYSIIAGGIAEKDMLQNIPVGLLGTILTSNGTNKLAEFKELSTLTNIGAQSGQCKIGRLLLQWGTVNITPVANTVTAGSTVTFPQPYSKPPFVTTNLPIIALNVVLNNGAVYVTETNFIPHILRTNTTVTALNWVAIGESTT